MKRVGICVLAVAFVMGVSSMAWAGQGCGKSAKVAGAAGGCDKTKCAKGDAKTASAKGCCSKGDAKTASATGCCSKGESKTASATGGCDKSKCGKGDAQTASAKGDCDKSKCGKGACPMEVDAGVAAVMASMPKMVYKVGDMETPCCKTATATAAASNAKVMYVVGDASYECKQTAMNKLAEMMEAELPKFTTVSYAVGEKVIHCPNEARATAAKSSDSPRVLLAGVQFENEKQARAVAAKLADKLKDMSGLAKTASAGGCSKSASGCSKSAAKAETASAGGCSKSAAKAETASADSGSVLKPGCCSKAQPAAVATAEATPVDADDETPALAQARQMVREIVEFVATAKAS